MKHWKWLALVLLMVLTLPAFAGGKGPCTMSTQDCLDKMSAKLKNRGWVGIEMDKTDHGDALVITRVVPGSPAEAAGLQADDVLLAVNGAKFADNKVAIISISGVIMSGEGYVKNQIDRARDDSSVKAVVVRLDSPGGTVTGSDYIFHHLDKLRQEKGIPLVVSMGSIATSGGYYVSMAVGEQEKSIDQGR